MMHIDMMMMMMMMIPIGGRHDDDSVVGCIESIHTGEDL